MPFGVSQISLIELTAQGWTICSPGAWNKQMSCHKESFQAFLNTDTTMAWHKTTHSKLCTKVWSHEVTLLRCHSTLNSCSNVISCHHPCALTHHSHS
ncbi:Uncharacterized protein DAT39_006845 [Clarias magur]|uniref:Uncharacterized protein n=1 Tax=Clarias magur TaxID=1594786 RepID=A0A8J4X6E9_CLAMG|nr:Uncharacterized protein DAT39_006845 [Clarias magur]